MDASTCNRRTISVLLHCARLKLGQGITPLARGARRPLGRPAALHGVTPARAGSTWAASPARSGCADYPHSRGEHCTLATPTRFFEGSLPLARGARGGVVDERIVHGITPARAGSTASRSECPHHAGDHPRSHGEHGVGGRERSADRGCPPPPLARGARRCAAHERGPRGITPLARGALRELHRHERTSGITPLARAALAATDGVVEPVGITPARAGSTRSVRSSSTAPRDHPRSRGEHLGPVIERVRSFGSPPLTRGAPPPRPRCGVDARDHPRSRGEHIDLTGWVWVAEGSPPLTRGAHRHQPRSVRVVRITPAHAGSTSISRDGCGSLRDHPRSRGEHAASVLLAR